MEIAYKNIHKNLIDDCKKGNTHAQFEIYQLYYKAMYNTCLRMLNDTCEAEDVMQDAFLQAFSNIDKYKGEVSFGAWLKKIVVNKSLDYLRKKKIDTYEINEQVVGFTDENDMDNTEDVNKKVEEIKKAISKLPDKYRTLITLYLLEGYDQKEISQLLNISYESVRTGYSRAKKKLQELLKNKNMEVWMN